MGNSPSVGLGGGSAHSSRDVRIVNPEKEVDRPTASRAPTHNEYTELPASLKSHNTSKIISRPSCLRYNTCSDWAQLRRLSSFKFFWWLVKLFYFCNRVICFGGSRSTKVDDFGTNRKRVCDFLSVRHSNFVLSCTLSEIVQVFCAHDPTPIPPYLIFGVF